MAKTELQAEYCLNTPKVTVPLDMSVADKSIKKQGTGLAKAVCPVVKRLVNYQVIIEDGKPISVTCIDEDCLVNLLRNN